MNRTFINSFKVEFARNANKLIYYLKKVYFIGKKIPDNLYERTKAKLILGVISKILNIIMGFIWKSLYLGIMVILPSYWITKNISLVKPYFLHIFFFLSFILASFMKTSIFDSGNQSAFYMIRLMRSDAREYYRSRLLYNRVMEFINFSIPMLVIGSFIHITPLKVLIILLELTAFRLIGEAIYLLMYDRLNINLEKHNVLQGVLMVSGLIMAYVLPIAKYTINLESLLFNVFIGGTVILVGIICLLYAWNYKRYTILSRELLGKVNLIDIESIKTDISFGDVKLNEKKINRESLRNKIYDNKEGYEYLNSIFFSRLKKVISFPIKIRVAIIGVIFLVGVCLAIFKPENGKDIIKIFEQKTSIFVFIVYMMSIGERVCRALFYNCDVKLLRYNYYRSGEVILNNFKIRLKEIIAFNLIPAITLCLCILGIVIVNGYTYKLVGMLPLFLCIICLSCFFSIHYLFIYYIIQPYSAELEVKSPWLGIINNAVYFICYFSTKINTTPKIFTLGVIVGTIVYMIGALILAYKFAPKTFKLR
ncbi:hypothetical protein RBU61_05385 [Tissierella sp. MB52-C2]|uniref:hypothetical protein n=1 Tax=Tissierella sp. MB52-C2 TaxID=3070999 RepID=UPI00280BA79D|nr:hypothetical protein [Tissierella sp. MB52-C2]WMM26109.1 hypothetical protein RBU61_05385 [Tissierella sp. MB52-C2]